MPYKDPEKQKAAKRKYYRRKYAEDPDFVEAERQRKLAHYEANRDERLPQMRAYSQEWYAKIEKRRRKSVKASGKKSSLNGHGRRTGTKKPAAKVARKLVAETKARPKTRVLRTRVVTRRPASGSRSAVKKSRPAAKRRR